MVKTSSYFCLNFADDKAHNKQGMAFFPFFFHIFLINYLRVLLFQAICDRSR